MSGKREGNWKGNGRKWGEVKEIEGKREGKGKKGRKWRGKSEENLRGKGKEKRKKSEEI